MIAQAAFDETTGILSAFPSSIGLAPWISRPSAPHPEDEEFEGGQLSSNLVITGLVPGAAPPARGESFATAGTVRWSLGQRPSWLLIQPSSDGTLASVGRRWVGGTRQNRFQYTRVSFDRDLTAVVGSGILCGLGIANALAGNPDSSNTAYIFLTKDAAATLSISFAFQEGGVQTVVQTLSLPGLSTLELFSLHKVGPIYRAAVMLAGGVWLPLGEASVPSLEPEFTGVTVLQQQSPCVVFGVDFLRFIDSDRVTL